MSSPTPEIAAQVESVASNLDLIAAFLIIAMFLILGLAVAGFILFTVYRWRGREELSIDSVLLHIGVPRNNEIKIDAMEQLFASLVSIKKGGWKQRFSFQPSISFEIVSTNELIKFYIWTPRKYMDLIEKQVHGAYPDADVLEVDEYNIFTEHGKVAYASLQLKKDNFYPIRIFRELPTDPLSSLTSTLAKMGKDEAAVIQMVISPADIPWQGSGAKFISSTKKQEATPDKAKFSVGPKTLEAIENKISKPGFEVNIRIVVVSSTEEIAQHHVTNIKTSFAQFVSDSNGFGSRKVKHKGSFIKDFLYRYQPMFHLFGNKTSVLNSEELATIFHFPNKQVTTPRIYWIYSKTAPAPIEIATEGLYLGMSIYRGTKRPVHISSGDRQRHMYIVGKTGTGKSVFLKDMIMQDIRAGKGLCFLDPHGDAAEELLEEIPPERAEDVIYFRPGDVDRPMGINLLEAKTEDQKHFVATSIINMMYKLFDPYKTGIVGPRFEHAVRNAILTSFAQPGTTFVELMRIFTDAKFVQELLPKVTDPIVRRYWTDQMAQTSDFHKSEVLDYITSKFGRFVTNKMIRNIIGQSVSSFNFREVMDNGKILLVNLSKGDIGEENSSFLGLILVPRILMAAMSRTDIPEEQRRDFYLYVDEFQNFATPDFAQIMSEARKYHLNLIVANQFIGQIDEEIKSAIFGNVGTIISYRVGVSDAGYLAHEYSPVFGEEDLLNIERFHVYVRTIVNNEPVPPFSMSLFKDMDKAKANRSPRMAEIIKEMSRLKYGRDVRLVESEIVKRAKL